MDIHAFQPGRHARDRLYIFRVWREQSWPEPSIAETFEPERTKLSLALEKAVDKKAPIKSADKKAPIKSAAQKDMIIAYLTDHVSGKNADFVELLGVKSTRVKTLLRELTEEDIVVAEGERKARTYRLKS